MTKTPNKHRFAYNRKTRKLYYVIGAATNARDGAKVIMYSDGDGNVFVRDLAEFQEQFNYTESPEEE